MHEYTPKHTKHFDQDTPKEDNQIPQTERKGYVPPAQNPYISAVEHGEEPAFSKVEQGALAPIVHKNPKHKRMSQTMKRTIIIVLCGFIALGIVAYMHRPVEIMVNGKRRSVTVNTTAEAIFKDAKLDIKPGNLVSVTGSVIKAKDGRLYSLKVNGKSIKDDDAAQYKVQSGDKLVFSHGANVVEPHSTEIKTIQPKLTMQGLYGAVAYISSWGKPTKQEILTGKISGKTAEGKIIQAGQDCVIKLVMPQPKGDKKLVALTFDDGPSIYTDRYLDILKKYGAKATFFALGENVQSYPDKLKHIMDAGHQIACHTYSHKQLTACTPAEVQEELSKSFSIIDKTTGKTTTALRPPYGAFNQKTWLSSKGLMSMSVLWTKDSEDWKRPGVAAIVSNSINNIKSGDIILMHDGGGNRDQDLEALPKIIESLQKQGYKLVTLQELLESDAHIPKEVATCSEMMPKDAVWPTEIGDL